MPLKHRPAVQITQIYHNHERHVIREGSYCFRFGRDWQQHRAEAQGLRSRDEVLDRASERRHATALGDDPFVKRGAQSSEQHSQAHRATRLLARLK